MQCLFIVAGLFILHGDSTKFGYIRVQQPVPIRYIQNCYKFDKLRCMND